MNAAGFGSSATTVLPTEIVTAIEDCGFFESIPLWAVTLIGGLFVWILSFIMILSVYGRFFKLYMYTAISPIPLSCFAGEPTQNVGKSFLKSYRPLQEQNGDMVGWIFIEGTKVNYPVMQTPDNPDYYLKHSFEKTWSDYGVPYVDESCTVGTSNNLVIYGHNMKNGSMFSGLVQYKSKEFFESHPVICFDTVDELGQYQVIAVFRYNTNNETFKYNKHSDMDEAKFVKYVANCKSRSLYDTGITAEYGDMLITLSTCEYTYTNGRFVVVAKKIVE